jgi:hypothetical protein
MVAAKRSTVIPVNVATWSGILAISFPLFWMVGLWDREHAFGPTYSIH